MDALGAFSMGFVAVSVVNFAGTMLTLTIGQPRFDEEWKFLAFVGVLDAAVWLITFAIVRY